jgi:hypothetical protein
MQITATGTRGKKPQASAAKAASDVNAQDDWDGELVEGPDADVAWLELAVREKETSRIRRQMEARRELERRMEEKRLRDLVEDWAF